MDRSAYPIEIAIALLVLGGIVYVGKSALSTPVVVTEKAKTSSFVEPPKATNAPATPTKKSGPAMKDVDIKLD